MSNPLFKKKPMDWLLNEAKATGEHTLKRTLGPVSLTALGVGAVIGAGIFVLSGLGAHYAGPGLMLSFVISGLGCAFAGLCYAEFAALIPLAGSAYTYAYAALGELIAWIIGWDLTLEYAMGASTVSSGWSNHFIEFLQIFHLKMPLWLAYDHWTALVTAENVIARQMAHVSDPSLAVGSQSFLMRVGDIITAQSPELLQRAHDMVAAPTVFGVEIGFNLPAFLIALVITAVLVIGIKESANFNATIVIVKVGVVLFVILLGMHYVSSSNWGHDWGSFAPMGFSGIGRGAAYIFFAYIGFDTVTVASEEAKRPERNVPIGIILALALGGILYVALTLCTVGVLRFDRLSDGAAMLDALGSVSKSHTLYWIVAIGGLAGNATVMLTSLLGQVRIFYVMARDRMLPPGVARIHRVFRTPARMTVITGAIVAVFAAVLPLTDLLTLVNIGTLAAFAIVCAGVLVLRIVNPTAPRPFRAPLLPLFSVAGGAACLYLVSGLQVATWIRYGIWFAVGILVYALYGFRNSRLRLELIEP